MVGALYLRGTGATVEIQEGVKADYNAPRISLGSRCVAMIRGCKDHVNMRILHPGWKAQDKGDCGNHGV